MKVIKKYHERTLLNKWIYTCLVLAKRDPSIYQILRKSDKLGLHFISLIVMKMILWIMTSVFPHMNCLIIFYNRHLRKNIEQSLLLKKKAWCINLLQSFETRLTFSTRSEKQPSSDHWMYYMCVGVYDMCTGHLY